MRMTGPTVPVVLKKSSPRAAAMNYINTVPYLTRSIERTVIYAYRPQNPSPFQIRKIIGG